MVIGQPPQGGWLSWGSGVASREEVVVAAMMSQCWHCWQELFFTCKDISVMRSGMMAQGQRFTAALLPRRFMTNPRSHHKGATGRVRTGDQRIPVLCHCQLGKDISIVPQAPQLCLHLREVETWTLLALVEPCLNLALPSASFPGGVNSLLIECPKSCSISASRLLCLF